MELPIRPGVRTLIMDRMVVGYHSLHRYDELAVRLQRMGIRPTDGMDRLLQIDELFDWAQLVIKQTSCFDDQRTVCYFCNSSHDHAAGRLCDCFREVLIQDFYDLRDKKLILGLPKNTIVCTSQCEDCGIPIPIQQRVVQRFYEKNPKFQYRGRRHCHKHWLQRKAAREEHKREERAELERLQKEASENKVSSKLELSSVELPEGPRGEA